MVIGEMKRNKLIILTKEVHDVHRCVEFLLSRNDDYVKRQEAFSKLKNYFKTTKDDYVKRFIKKKFPDACR